MNRLWKNVAFFVDFQKLKEMLTVKQKVLQLVKEAGFNKVDS